MKKRIAIGAATVVVGAAAAGCGGSGGTPAGQPASTTAGSTATVVMAEPGCHWFSTPNGNVKVESVSGPVTLSNYDEAALKVESNGKQALDGPIPVGGKATLEAGTYTITMVGQEPTDNTLTLKVS